MLQMSIWEKETFFAPQDVIIIGSGFTGLWSALQLKEKHPLLKITILERGIIPTGASTRNAGFSCFGSPSELLQDAVDMGHDKMWQLVELRYKGLQKIRQYFSDTVIDYDASGGYECFLDDSADWTTSQENLSWLNDGLKTITGETDTFHIGDHKLESFGFKGFDHLIENKLEGGLHSGKLVQALLQTVQRLGVNVMTGVEVLSFDALSDKVMVNTSQFTMQSTQLLICTNAFTKQLVPLIDIIPNRGQVLVTSPIPNLPFKGTFHFDKGYYYFRNLNDRLLIGGGRNMAFDEESTTDMSVSPVIQNELERFIKQHLLTGINFTITDRWSGIMAMGHEKMPVVQALGNNIFCCARMSGMGVALAPVVAGQVATMMTA